VQLDAFRFGDFTIDVTTAALRRNGVRVPLQPQPARLLLFLVQRPGRVVTRDEIRAHVWGDTVVEFDQSINYCIRQIRQAIDDPAAVVVQTVPRQGYRFTVTPTPVERTGERRRFASTRGLVAAASLLLAFGTGYVAGVAAREKSHDPVTFVYRHLTGEANCPYMRFLSPLLRSS
jgi:DNA-binding winged helix-turn-helix (wHTH) protein